MADGSVVIKVEMDTGGLRAGVGDIRAGCRRAADLAERTGRTMTRAMAEGTQSMAACGDGARRVGGAVLAGCEQAGAGLRTVTAENDRARGALDGLRAGLGAVKSALATAFAPIVTAAAPLLEKLCTLAARAASYVARFFSVLSGGRSGSAAKKAAAGQDAVTKSVAATGKAAADAARNLAGLDELNIWQEKTASGGGGGGAPDLDLDLGLEEEAGEPWDFVVRLRDILFRWENLNPELIAEKILTGLCAAAGGIIGYTLGGPMGGLVGLTMGALLGVKFSQVLFNGDGKLSRSEIVKLVLTALGGMLGGVLGFVIGGPVGAAIGFTVGAGISVALSNVRIAEGMSVADWVKKKVVALVQKALDARRAVVQFAAKVRNDAAQWWSNVQTWWNGKVGAVKEFTTNVANHAATWWGNVKNWWGAKVGAVKSFTTSVANHAATWWGNVQNWWGGKVGAVKEFTTKAKNEASTWWGNVQNWWGGKVGAVKNFTTSVNNTAATWWNNVKTWWSQKSAGGVTFSAKITSFVDALKNKVLDFKARITSFIDAIKDKTLSFTAKLTGVLSYLIPGARLGMKAGGGVYANGRWRPVEGYAGGGNPRSGRLFIANENGMPELVGQIGGHTAVMNNGQIVASVAAGVYQAVAAAASQVGGWFRSMSAELANIPPAIKMLANMPTGTPIPVMASGKVLPPRAAYAADEAAELKAAVRELRDALLGGGVGQDVPIVVNVALDGQVDGRNLFRAVQTQARIEKRITGREPFGG